MAVRPGPRVFGQIKTSWAARLLSVSGGRSGVVWAWLAELRKLGVESWELLLPGGD